MFCVDINNVESNITCRMTFQHQQYTTWCNLTFSETVGINFAANGRSFAPKKKAWNFARLPSQLKARRMPKEQKLDLKDWEWNGAIDGGFIQRENSEILSVAPSQ